MKKVKGDTRSNQDLHKRTEAFLRSVEEGISEVSLGDCRRIIRDLYTSQIELEKQNTELRRENEELTESHALFTDLYDFAPVGYVTINDKGRILEANLTLARMLETDRGLLINKPLHTFVFPEHEDAYFLNRDEVIRTKQPQTFDLYLRRSEKEPFWVRMDCVYVDEGTGYRIRCAITDVSARKDLERKLRKTETEHRELLETISDLAWEFDENAAFTYCSPKYSDVLGYEPEELVGKSAFSIMPPETVAEAREEFSKIAEERKPLRDFENWNIHRNGEPRCMLSTAIPMFDEEGNYKGYRGVDRDVTDWVKDQEALRASERSYHEIFDSSPDAIFVHDMKSGAIIDVNRQMCEMFGFSREEALQLEVEDLSPGEPPFTQEEAGVWIGKAAEEGPQTFEWLARRKSGEFFWDETCLRKATIDDRACILAFVRDITDRKRAEDELGRYRKQLETMVEERTGELKVANKDLEDFAYSVSHDLKAPLRAITSFSEIISQRYRDSLNDEARRYFDHIHSAGDKMNHLIEDLLGYSRLGRQAVHFGPVPLDEVLSVLRETFQIRLKDLGGSLVIPGPLPTVRGDPTLLNQVFTNLVDNALSYRRPDIAPRVEVLWQADGDRVIVSVKDNGIGIPSEFEEKVFRIFERLHRDEERPGTGIGLAIVRKAASMLGARIRLESTVGEGSTFHVDIQKG